MCPPAKRPALPVLRRRVPDVVLPIDPHHTLQPAQRPDHFLQVLEVGDLEDELDGGFAVAGAGLHLADVGLEGGDGGGEAGEDALAVVGDDLELDLELGLALADLLDPISRSGLNMRFFTFGQFLLWTATPLPRVT